AAAQPRAFAGDCRAARKVRGCSAGLVADRAPPYGGRLQRVPQVLDLEAAQRRVDSTRPRHGLEALTHLARQHQPSRLDREARKLILIAAGQRLHRAVYPRAREEMRLRRKAREAVPRAHARLGERSEIHPGSDVLQTRVAQRIVVGALPEMAYERAAASLWKIILGPRQPIIDPKHHAVAERAGDVRRPGCEPRAVLGDVAVLPSASG